MNPLTDRKNDPVRSMIESGRIYDTKQSAIKLTSTLTTYKLFGSEEVKLGYPELALYNTAGKNPFDGNSGQVMGLKLYLFSPDFAPLDLAGTDNDYAPYIALSKLIAQTKFKVTLGKDEIRSFLFSDAVDPLPQLLNYRKIGAGITPENIAMAGVSAPSGSVENDRNVIRLPINVNDGVSLKIEGILENGTPGAALVNHLIVCRLFCIEDKQTAK